MLEFVFALVVVFANVLFRRVESVSVTLWCGEGIHGRLQSEFSLPGNLVLEKLGTI